jgi:two-component system, OmpR family, sensor histidine kinase CiaH
MPSIFNKHKLTFITVGYWVLLLYILAALLWWFIALDLQNKEMSNMRFSVLDKDNPQFASQQDKIITLQKRKTTQYIGEGVTFLVVILIGAAFVYRAIRKQFTFGKQQQNFMMAVTHELNTPIAIAQLNLETIEKRSLDVNTSQGLIKNTLQEIARLHNLSNNILLASQFDAGIKPIHLQNNNFSDIVKATYFKFEKRLPKRQFISNIDNNIFMQCDAFYIEILLNNLIENANKYSNATGAITIKLNLINNKINLQIIDEGVGVDANDSKKIFEKFYRAGNENIRTTKGTGLGLYLCKKIVTSHKGYISVTNNLPTGSIFTAIFTT